MQQLRSRDIAVTSPDPFVVLGTPRPNAFRICLGTQISDLRMHNAIATIASVFRQYPRINDFV